MVLMPLLLNALMALPALGSSASGAQVVSLIQRAYGTSQTVGWNNALNAQHSRSVHFAYTLGIVAGCQTPEFRKLLSTSPLAKDERFATFFAEGDLMAVPGRKNDIYPARSRPHALAQWLEATKPQEAMVAILDPDFVFIQPLSSHPDLHLVRPGKMVAQQYDLGVDFMPGFAHAGEETPSMDVGRAVAEFATGPPWVLDMKDLRRMLPDWARYTDSWPQEKGLLREQEAFCMAAVRNEIPAHGQSNFMISNPAAWHEAWSKETVPSKDWAPYVLHYCQTYSYGNWTFHKALIADDSIYGGQFQNTLPGPLRCEAPLLQEAPAPPASEPDRSKFMQAWLLWKLFPALNSAFVAYRDVYCPASMFKADAAKLTRTMQPRRCGQRTSTRYRVVAGAAASWNATGAPGDDICGEAAQAAVL